MDSVGLKRGTENVFENVDDLYIDIFLLKISDSPKNKSGLYLKSFSMIPMSKFYQTK